MNIELRNIHKRFGSVHANNDISVTLNEGKIIGVLGENGAGKSTLMKILSGYQPADSGTILINGQPVAYTGPRAAIEQGIGMLQQDPLDVGAFTVLENFVFRPEGGFMPNRRAARKHILAANTRFGFELDPDMPADNMSIAQRQQLEIVRLLWLGVKALILDEPTTGISAEQKEALFSALRNLAQEDGLIVLLVSHKLEDVIALCDEVFVLQAGKLVGEREMPATPSELVQMMFGELLPPEEREQVTMGAPVMTLKNVSISDGRLHMNGINLDIRAGEVIGLAGLEGSGQSLLMRACAGLERVDNGQIVLNGQEMTKRAYRHFMGNGVIFGAAGRIEEGLIAGMTLTEHMAMAMDNKSRIDWNMAQSRMDSQIEHYDVRGRSTDNIEQLSGGNQQRVLMALLPDQPEVLILEQPTRGLDVESARWIWKQLLERRKTGTAIVFSSAELDEIVTYSDRILVCYSGETYEVDDASQTDIDELGHLIGGQGIRKSKKHDT